jgi:hypothetical protein
LGEDLDIELFFYLSEKLSDFNVPTLHALPVSPVNNVLILFDGPYVYFFVDIAVFFVVISLQKHITSLTSVLDPFKNILSRVSRGIIRLSIVDNCQLATG